MLPNALIPVVTLGGLAYANLLTGAVMTETIFSWPGLGRYTFRSAVALDFPAIMGITLVVAVAYLIINLLIDISYALLDPAGGAMSAPDAAAAIAAPRIAPSAVEGAALACAATAWRRSARSSSWPGSSSRRWRR